jgi:hypothetical protein
MTSRMDGVPIWRLGLFVWAFGAGVSALSGQWEPMIGGTIAAVLCVSFWKGLDRWA